VLFECRENSLSLVQPRNARLSVGADTFSTSSINRERFRLNDMVGTDRGCLATEDQATNQKLGGS
jgi:hypothetical protein